MSYQQPSNKREQQPFNSWTEYQSVNPSPRGATMLHRSRVGAFAITIAFVIFPGAFVLGQEQTFTAHPSTQEPNRLVTLETLKKWEGELSNWGRWGKEDQRGLLNLITPEKTKQALALVKEAKTVTLQINPFKKTGIDTGGFGENVH